MTSPSLTIVLVFLNETVRELAHADKQSSLPGKISMKTPIPMMRVTLSLIDFTQFSGFRRKSLNFRAWRFAPLRS